MELKKQSIKFLRQHKGIALLLIVLPLIALLLWSLKSGMKSNSSQQLAQKGLNVSLPDAHLKEDKPLDKMSYYDKAAADSSKRKELIKNDPYYNEQGFFYKEEHGNTDFVVPGVKFGKSADKLNTLVNTTNYSGHTSSDKNEEKVYSKLEQLNKVLSKSAAMPSKTAGYSMYSPAANSPVKSADVDRLEQMMHTMNQKDGEDPEMQQLNGMLDKIMSIQHPDIIAEKARQSSEERKGQVYAVSAKEESIPVSFIDNGVSDKKINGNIQLLSQTNNFYALDDDQTSENVQNSIEAVIDETQTVVSGSVVKFRLVNDVYINGVLIPKDNFLFGTAALNAERLSVKINSIHYKNSLFPVALSVYDMDGMEGIYIPGAITRDVAKQSADKVIQNIGITSLDPSFGAQAASAGIEAAKSLASKKVKLVKVTVKAGYQVLLHDEKQKQNS